MWPISGLKTSLESPARTIGNPTNPTKNEQFRIKISIQKSEKIIVAWWGVADSINRITRGLALASANLKFFAFGETLVVP